MGAYRVPLCTGLLCAHDPHPAAPPAETLRGGRQEAELTKGKGSRGAA